MTIDLFGYRCQLRCLKFDPHRDSFLSRWRVDLLASLGIGPPCPENEHPTGSRLLDGTSKITHEVVSFLTAEDGVAKKPSMWYHKERTDLHDTGPHGATLGTP